MPERRRVPVGRAASILAALAARLVALRSSEIPENRIEDCDCGHEHERGVPRRLM